MAETRDEAAATRLTADEMMPLARANAHRLTQRDFSLHCMAAGYCDGPTAVEAYNRAASEAGTGTEEAPNE